VVTWMWVVNRHPCLGAFFFCEHIGALASEPQLLHTAFCVVWTVLLLGFWLLKPAERSCSIEMVEAMKERTTLEHW
jgi:hypothetical protein